MFIHHRTALTLVTNFVCWNCSSAEWRWTKMKKVDVYKTKAKLKDTRALYKILVSSVLATVLTKMNHYTQLLIQYTVQRCHLFDLLDLCVVITRWHLWIWLDFLIVLEQSTNLNLNTNIGGLGLVPHTVPRCNAMGDLHHLIVLLWLLNILFNVFELLFIQRCYSPLAGF